MDITLSLFAFVLSILGIIGCIVPALPGVVLSYAGLLCAYFTSYSQMSAPALWLWLGVTVAVSIADYFLPAWMTRRFGGSRAGAIGATVGVFAGFFLFPPVGILLGPFLGAVLGELLNYFFGGGSVSFVAFSCLAFFGSAFVNSLNWALVSDTVEYGEWRTGVRSEGTVYTGFTFFRKVSQALAGFFPGWMLTQIGYVPNVAQADHTIEGLRQLIFIYPSALAVVTIVAMGCFYSLNEKMYVRIVEEIEARKRTA